MATSLTALTACGGGGGGAGAINDVKSWVQNDLTNLSEASGNVNTWFDIVSDLESELSGASASALITGPTTEDISKAKDLLQILTRANNAWTRSNNIINNLGDDTEKYNEFNKEEYKKAYQAIQFLNNNVKPLLEKVASGQAITLTEFNLMDNPTEADKVINSYDADSYALQKSVKKTETVTGTPKVDISTTTGTASSSTSSWATVHAGGGQETRTITTTTPNYKITTTTPCELTRVTYLNGTTVDSACTYGTSTTTTVELEPTVETVTETREGNNPVVTTVDLEASVVNTVEETAEQTTTTYNDATDTSTETQEGSATTNTTNRDVTSTTDNGDNTSTVVITRYVDTTVTTPITTRVYRTRHYTDTVTKQTRTVTTTTPRQELTYKDGTSEIINGTSTVTATGWTTVTVSTTERSENILQSETTANRVVTTSDAGTQISSQLESNAYTNTDINLGTKTENMSAVVNDHKTSEFNTNHGLDTINAADAYARGWTGKGAVLGVIDTYQQTDHPELDGKYKWYNDYTRYDNTVETQGNTQVHGTHVAGIIAGKKDGNTMHGVAYDAELVGANVDYYGYGGISKGKAQEALHDMAKLKDSNGENLNIVAVNMSFNTPQLFTSSSGSTVTELADGTYNGTEITAKIHGNGVGDARYYKVATDNDIILVNSAGNAGYNHAGDPGIWATEVDSNGNLVLGGKMLIVGNWDGANVSGNKAGHVCLDINTSNNTCNDTYKISDFYILAPGNDIHSSVPTHLDGNGYMNSSGTSMSAPHVTGALGILNQMWPHMKGENLVKLVLATADKNLNNYHVNIHGQGMLDLNEATKPQGATGIPTTGRTNGPIINVNGTYFATGTSLPSSLSNLKVMILDEYERDYYVNLGSSMKVKDMRKVSDIDMMMNNSTYLPVQSMWGNFTQGGNYDLGYMNFGLYTGENGGGDYSANVGKNFMLHKNFKLKTSIGTMNEQDNWLGNSSDGVLAVGDNNVTNYGQIGVEYALGSNVISFDYTKGYTDINTTDNSLIKGFSDVESESMKIAYEVHKDQHNTWGISLSTPMHITSGKMDLSVPESRTLNGDVNYADIESDMSTGKIEKNLGFFYNHTSEHDLDASWNFKAEYRQDISGVAGNDGVNLGLNYVKKFSGACGFLLWKNPKCYNADGTKKDIKAMYAAQGKEPDQLTKHGLVYDLETDMFVPIKKK